MNTRHIYTGLALIRLQLGITQKELADSLGISRSLLAMAETGKRSLPAHTLPLLTGMEEVSRQVPPLVRDNEKQEERLAASLLYNRVNKRLRQRNAAANALLRAAAAGLAANSGSNTATPTTAAVHTGQALLQSIPDLRSFNELRSVQTVQKTALEQQLQYRMQERKAAAVKGQELRVFLTYTNSMITAEDKRMNSLRIPLLKKNAAIRKAKLEYKKLLLEKKLLHFDGPALLRRDLQINILERQVNELDGLLTMFRPFSASVQN